MTNNLDDYTIIKETVKTRIQKRQQDQIVSRDKEHTLAKNIMINL